MKRFWICSVISFACWMHLSGQVSLLPTAVFIDESTGIASLEVINPTDQTQEVSISFSFAYLGSDLSGNLMKTTKEVCMS